MVTAPHSTWAERSLNDPVACRTVRLRLQRLVGDNYVHLNEWELYALDTNGGFEITAARKSGGNFELTWNALAGQWYEVQSSTNLANWSSAGFQKGTGDSATQPGGHAGWQRDVLPGPNGAGGGPAANYQASVGHEH